MTKRILIVLILFLTFLGNAQTNNEINIDDLVINYIKELQSRKIDTICVYEDYCIGCELTYESSKLYDEETCKDELKQQPAYIFWKEKGKTYLTKINTCFEYPGIIISKDNFWEIYFSKITTIKKEVVKSFSYETFENNKKSISILRATHSSYQVFKMINKGKSTIKVFDHFKLRQTCDIFPDKLLYNISYQHNINLKSKLIIDLLEKITSEAEKNNNFKKVKSRKI
ncbi:hypothetical protein ACFFLS_22905 [Flavobacterium procerum]|uniref:Uncharacterized protein n=1 Tax=Flavobacterium procerum TaxID=1455569 RepID=A0ABV6BWT9_9FLAO